MNKADGIWSAEPHKRYKNFVNSAADIEMVWFRKANLLSVWPEQEYAQRLYPGEEIKGMDVHVFCCSVLGKADPEDYVCVFPNDRDSLIVRVEKLIRDIQEELDRVE